MRATLLHHPRKLWLRRALFQVHLWSGILLSLYAIVISLSGSILVFQDEIRLLSLRHSPYDSAHLAPISAVVDHARQHFSNSRLTFVGFPQQNSPWWTLYLENANGKPDLAYADAAKATPIALQHRLFIDFVLDLHVYLLAGQTGFIVNCIAGMGFLLLAVTGLAIWWPGMKLWKRALIVSFRHGWKRVNYDLHSCIGFFTVAIVSWWGITAIYFLLPKQIAAVVNAVSPLAGMKAPNPVTSTNSKYAISLEKILGQVPSNSRGLVSGVGLPEQQGGIITVYVDRREPGDFSHRDILSFDGHTGNLLTTWHYGENKSVGDWFLWLMYPLHFGTLWGIGVKVLWALLGLGVSVLSVTGLVMYWNRKLGKWWKQSSAPQLSMPA